LRTAAAPVARIDEVLLAQVRRMKRRLLEEEGAGLAGTQVGFMRRVFVYRASVDSEVQALVNPSVVAASCERAMFLEGCLSYRAVSVLVERPAAVRVVGEGLDGGERVLDVEGYEASLLQHEIDHLDGILTLDRAAPAERKRAIGVLMERSQPLPGIAIAGTL